MYTCRDYQTECVEAIKQALGEYSRVLVTMPTGTGKTIVFSHLIDGWNGGRVLVVAPMIELIDQAAKKIRQVTGISPAIEQAQRRSNECPASRSPFVVGSKQTLTGKAERYKDLRDIGLVIWDEAHLAITQKNADMVDHFVDQGAKLVGFTATPTRGDGRGMKNMFEHSAYEMFISDAVPAGWLVPPRCQCIELESLDLSEVGVNAGDFKQGELGDTMATDEVVFEIAAVTAREIGKDKTAVFCAGVQEARKVALRLQDRYNIRADWVCGSKKLCTDDRRRDVLHSFQHDPDGIQVVCNVGVLTTGWDFPGLRHIVMARPTKSLGLYTQIIGRGTRPLEGVVDFPGSTPESRVRAIENSEKPYFTVTDLRDSSRHHKLVGAQDVLAGKLGYAVTEAMQLKLEDANEPVDLFGLAEQTKLEIELAQARAEEKRQQEELRERKRMAAIEAEARYKAENVSPFDTSFIRELGPGESKQGARWPFGKFRGKLIRETPNWYLKWADVSLKSLRPMIKGALKKEMWIRENMKAEHAKKMTPKRKAAAQRDLEEVNRLFEEAIA